MASAVRYKFEPLEKISVSLLDQAFERFCVMNKQTVDDGYGGTARQWVQGASFSGALVYDSSAQTAIANSMTAHGSYVLTVRKNIVLDYYDVIKRLKDGATFQLTTDSDDLKTPDSAGLNMRQYQAKEYIIS